MLEPECEAVLKSKGWFFPGEYHRSPRALNRGVAPASWDTVGGGMDKASSGEEPGELACVLKLPRPSHWAPRRSESQNKRAEDLFALFHKPPSAEWEKWLVICKLCDAGGLVT